MGKFSGSLEKSGYEDDLEELTGSGKKASSKKAAHPASPKPAPAVPPPPPAGEPVKPRRRSASPDRSSLQGLQGRLDTRLFNAINRDGYLPELFKIIRSRILNPGEGRTIPKTIMVTSVVPKEGKSFITANLGVSLARGLDQHCLLVDCDLRRPALATLFGVSPSPGLAEYLRDGLPLAELIAKTGINKLSLLPSGRPPLNPAELLSSARMQTLIGELSSRYDDRLILFDSPPALVAAESAVLAGQTDAVLLVVRQGLAGKTQVEKLIESIGPKRILGVVFNDYTANPLENAMAKGYGYYRGGEYS